MACAGFNVESKAGNVGRFLTGVRKERATEGEDSHGAQESLFSSPYHT